MQARTCRPWKRTCTSMSRKQSSSSFQQPFSSTGSSDMALGIRQRRWFRLLGLVLILYVVFLPLWWAALLVVTSIAAAFADFLYHFFNSAVSIADSRVARVTLEAGPAVGDQPVESGLRMETISYGMPM